MVTAYQYGPVERRPIDYFNPPSGTNWTGYTSLIASFSRVPGHEPLLKRSVSLSSVDTRSKVLRLNHSACVTPPADAQYTNGEVTQSEMPKKTTSNEKRSSATTKLFRSMSLSSRKQSASKDHSTDEDHRNSSGPSSPDSRVSVLLDQNADLLNERNEAMGDANKIKTEHDKTIAKLRDAEREIENLKLLLASSYRDEINEMSRKELSMIDSGTGKTKNVIYPSKMEQHETTIEANAVPLSSSTPCKECERFREDIRSKSVVEVVALRKYVLQLSEALSEGDHGRRNFLNDFEQKLVSAQMEKETALEELAHVIDQRDQLVRERDKALEEWGRAAGKWDNTLDQVDSLMTELNQVKLERDNLKKQQKQTTANLKDENGALQTQVDVPQKERSNSLITREKHENTETLRQMSTELSKAQQRCLEMDAKMTSLSDKAESYRRERDHAKEQWRQSVKERKRLHREVAVIVQARDEAIQKCFSTAEQLNRLKEEHNQLLNRLAKTGLNARNSSEQSIPCSLKECKFCSDDPSSSFESHDSSHTHVEGEEIRVTMEKDEPHGNISIARVSCNGRSFIAVMDVSKPIQKSRNIRKYDEIVSINEVPMTDADQNLVRSLLQEATTLINMVLRRPVTTCQMNFDLELSIPKKSKALGFECGLYVKEMKYGVAADENRTLYAGDYVVKVNGKHLDKVIASALEKVTKKGGDKLKLNVTRTVQANFCKDTKLKYAEALIMRRSKRPSSTGDDNNRLSLISNDSSISMSSRFSGNSSMGSMSSYADSCLADSASDISLSKHSSHFLVGGRIGTGIYSPSSEPRLDTSKMGESPDEKDEDATCQSNPEDTDTDGSLRTLHSSSINRKSVSTSQLPVPRRRGAGPPPSRVLSAIPTVRSEEGGLNTVIRRSETSSPVTPKGEGSRIIRLEKKPFHNLGLEVSGGNLLGIYVTELTEDSVLKATGLKIGDRLLKVNSFDLTRATLDHATRTVKLLNTCSYLRIEAQYIANYKEVLKVTPFDSLYVRTKHAYRAMAPDELSFTVGETLHVINTRANYDQARQSWKWVAQRARKDGKDVEEGLVPCMGSLPDHVDSSQTFQKFESESEELTSDDAVSTLKRGSSERKSLLQRYRKLRKRQSKDNVYNMDENVNNNKVIFYEILSKFSG